MLWAIESVLLAIAGLLVVPAGFFALENLLALLPTKHRLIDESAEGTRPRLAVVVPAHNEQDGIARTIQSVRSQMLDADRVIVVADNCSDQTGDAAVESGAEVIERTNATERGKGFALGFGLRHLETDPPDLVVFIDADCELEPNTLSSLASQVFVTGTIAQAFYVLQLPPGHEPSVRDRVSAFAIRVKNQTRPLGLARLGGSCLITGSGFAVPWSLCEPAMFERGDIVEDMTIGLELAVQGHPPRLCTTARVNSVLPIGDAAKKSQRERWEHGHVDTMLKRGLPLALRGIVTLRWRLLLLGLELLVPPLSLLVLLALGVACITGLTTLLGGRVLPFIAASSALIAVALGTAAGWVAVGREVLPLRMVPGVAWYALAKVPIYIGAIFRRQTEWIRTERD